MEVGDPRYSCSLAIDFFDDFGLERFTEPEKPLNEMNSDFI